MKDTRSKAPRAGALGVLLIASAFIAGPTPGDIGGCGNDLSGQTVPGTQPQSEYDYFDQGMCAHMCLRLRDLGVLCEALSPAPPNCDPNSTAAYVQCVRGGLAMVPFGATFCPHTCANYHGVYTGATQEDIDVCGHIIDGMSASDLAGLIQSPPAPCVGVCQ